MLARVLPFLLLSFGIGGLSAVPEEKDAVPGLVEPAAAEDGKEAERQDGAPQPDQVRLQNMIRRLSHDAFEERRAAQEELLDWGMQNVEPAIETCYRLYQESEDPEVMLRSREVLKILVIAKQPWDGEGYLGIQMEGDQVKNEAGEIQPAVRITQVREGTGAAAADLLANDLVLGVDAMIFNDLLPTRQFSDYIRSKKPGDAILLHLQRDGKFLKVRATLRRRSPLLDQTMQWGNQLQLPEQSELDEADFREWLKKRKKAQERAR